MSATIYWRSLQNRKSLSNTTAPSSFEEYLENALGTHGFPMRLSEIHIQTLSIAKRLTKDTNFQKDIEELIDAIEQHNEIEIWAEY